MDFVFFFAFFFFAFLVFCDTLSAPWSSSMSNLFCFRSSVTSGEDFFDVLFLPLIEVEAPLAAEETVFFDADDLHLPEVVEVPAVVFAELGFGLCGLKGFRFFFTGEAFATWSDFVLEDGFVPKSGR